MCPNIRNTVRKYTRNELEMKGDDNQSEIRKAPRNLTQPENSNQWQKVQGYPKIWSDENFWILSEIDKTNIKFKQPKNSLQYKLQ